MAGVITIHVGRSYCLEDVNAQDIVAEVIALAEVIAMFHVLFIYLRQMFCLNIEYTCSIYMYSQMLLPWLMLLPIFCGRCSNH